MGEEDPWLAPDKLYHVLFCFSLTFLFSIMASITRYPFLRRHSIRIGSIASLLAGAAKEAADELGFFRSAGASAKDAIADISGVLLACFGLSLIKHWSRSRPDHGTDQSQTRGISLVWIMGPFGLEERKLRKFFEKGKSQGTILIFEIETLLTKYLYVSLSF